MWTCGGGRRLTRLLGCLLRTDAHTRRAGGVSSRHGAKGERTIDYIFPEGSLGTDAHMCLGRGVLQPRGAQ